MVLKAIANRRSVRDYKKDDVSDDLVFEIIKAGQFAPSAMHNRAWEFIVIRDSKTKRTLYELLGQEFLTEAPVLIVTVTDTAQTELPFQDIAVVSENMMIQATELGLGTVWKNVSEEYIDDVKKLLEIPKNFTCINIIPVGYPATKKVPYTDKDFDKNKIHLERF